MKREIKQNEKITKVFQAVETKDINEETRTLVVRISTKNPDRSNDEMIPSGCDISKYMGNPVVAAFHNYNKPSIGKTLDIQIDETGIIAKLEFVPAGVNPEADMLWEMYKGGYMNAWSVGFMPVEWQQKQDRGYIFTKWELLEYSAVLVPDNSEALTLLRGKGLNVDEVTEKTIEEVEDKSVETVESFRVALKSVVEAGIDLSAHLTEDEKKSVQTIIAADIKAAEDAAVKAIADQKEKEVSEFVSSLRDCIRGTDKSVGLQLRSISNYLKNQKGGEK